MATVHIKNGCRSDHPATLIWMWMSVLFLISLLWLKQPIQQHSLTSVGQHVQFFQKTQFANRKEVVALLVVRTVDFGKLMFSYRSWSHTFSFCSRHEVRLHPGQLTLLPFRRRAPPDGEVASPLPVSIVVHLSAGDTTVQKPHSSDTFTLITHKNEYKWVFHLLYHIKYTTFCSLRFLSSTWSKMAAARGSCSLYVTLMAGSLTCTSFAWNLC